MKVLDILSDFQQYKFVFINFLVTKVSSEMNSFLTRCKRVEPYLQARSRRNLEEFLEFYMGEDCTKNKSAEANIVEYGRYLERRGLKCVWLKLRELLEIAEVSS